MNKLKLLLTLALFGGIGLADLTQAETLAIVNGTIIDATGNPPIRNGILLIEDSRISAVGRAKDIVVPDNAQVFDASGKYLIPGLIDANLHLFLNIDTETLVKYEDLVSNPEGTYETICEFLNVRYIPALLDPEFVNPALHPM